MIESRMLSPDLFTQSNSDIRVLAQEMPGNPHLLRVSDELGISTIYFYSFEDVQTTGVLRITRKETVSDFQKKGHMRELTREAFKVLSYQGIRFVDGQIRNVGLINETGLRFSYEPSNGDDFGGLRSLVSRYKAGAEAGFPTAIVGVGLYRLSDDSAALDFLVTTLLQEEWTENKLIENPMILADHFMELFHDLRSKRNVTDDCVDYNFLKRNISLLEIQSLAPETISALKTHPFLTR